MKILITDNQLKAIIIENSRGIKLANQFKTKYGVSDQIFNLLKSFDQTDNKKLLPWLIKIYAADHPDMDDLRNTITEYQSLLSRRSIENTDIFKYKNFNELKSDVHNVNQNRTQSVSELQNDFDRMRNNFPGIR